MNIKCTNLHGGLYFIRRGEFSEALWQLCMEIKETYSDYQFSIFSKLADEPIIALACSIKNCILVDKLHEICFLPVVNRNSIRYNRKEHRIQYIEAGKRYNASILHFSNRNAERALYRTERDRIVWVYRNAKYKCVMLWMRYAMYWWNDYFGTLSKAKGTVYEYSPAVIKKIWRFIKDRHISD